MGRPPQIVDAELLAVARRIFCRDGLGAPVKEIAAELGVSEAAIFKRYQSKSDLIAAAMVPPVPDMAFLLAPLDASADARAALSLVLVNLIAYFRETIPVVLPLLAEPGIGPQRLMRQSSEPSVATIAGIMGQRLTAMTHRGRLRAADPLAAAGLLITTAHSLALFEIMGFHGGATPPRLIESMIDTLWQGLNPQA